MLFVVFGIAFILSSCSKDDDEGGMENSSGNVPSAAQAVDLGLPSGIKWANMNIGATSITGYGDYFAWGETKTKKKFIWETYLLCNGSSTTMTKYCTSLKYGEVDHKEVLDLADDAAHANWGGKWRMPTDEDYDELIENCYLVWTASYNNSGVAGCIVYKAKSVSDKGVVIAVDGSSSADYSLSDTHIFMPAAGNYGESGFSGVGASGFYWTSSVYTEKCYGAWRQPFCDYGAVRMKFTSRCNGFTVRAVCK